MAAPVVLQLSDAALAIKCAQCWAAVTGFFSFTSANDQVERQRARQRRRETDKDWFVGWKRISISLLNYDS